MILLNCKRAVILFCYDKFTWGFFRELLTLVLFFPVVNVSSFFPPLVHLCETLYE